MRVAIYGRTLSEIAAADLQQVFDCLRKHKVSIVLHRNFKTSIQNKLDYLLDFDTFDSHEDIADKADFLFSLGGDGTLLDTAVLVKDSGVPVIGINFGRLGFLASIHKNEIDNAVQSIINKEYVVEQRKLLSLTTENEHFKNRNFALNDIIIHKRDSSAMMIVHAYINDTFLNSYWSDGLIIATPTGSTAYSLSCGGPIVHPKSNNIVITPISPHNLNVRPVVLPNDVQLAFEVECRNSKYLVSCDSRTEMLEITEKITVRQADFCLNLVRLSTENYFLTLRNKLNWGLDIRN